MKLPTDTVIARQKLTDYLLSPRDDHDKSGFLRIAGYAPADAVRLEADLRTQILNREAAPAGESPYGQKYIIRGTLTGPNGRSLHILSVWMRENATGLTKFITLYPNPA
jgi:hypothetical protein